MRCFSVERKGKICEKDPFHILRIVGFCLLSVFSFFRFGIYALSFNLCHASYRV
jgi:hypothetical protein